MDSIHIPCTASSPIHSHKATESGIDIIPSARTLSNKHSKVNNPTSTSPYCLFMILLARKELGFNTPPIAYLDSRYDVVVWAMHVA